MKLSNLMEKQMRKFWEAWMASTISIGKMKASGFGVIFLTLIVITLIMV